MKKLILFTITILLVSCSGAGTPATSTPTAIPTATQPAFEATKLYQLTAEMLTYTAAAPQNQSTVEAIIATKAAGATAKAQTMTALPTLTLTPTIPPSSPTCSSLDIKAVYLGSQGATQTILAGVTLTNISGQPCFLQLWPAAMLVDASGNPLSIRYTYTEPYGNPYDPAASLGLATGQTASFSLQWGNWCPAPVKPAVSIRISLPQSGGTLTVPTDLSGGGACNEPNSLSWVGIFPITIP